MWLPWKFLIRAAARSQGFLDPITLLAQLSKFSQPSEVAEPIELLRAGVVFHARGLINSRVVQHNLDWVWPYWIEKQFDPTSKSFIPRAFSLTHVNLTHRNWTAIGIPNRESLPIVDPRGLLTPFWDKWSLDTWIVTNQDYVLLPSRTAFVKQKLEIGEALTVTTKTEHRGLRLCTKAQVIEINNKTICNLNIKANSDITAWLVIALRPYNPEGVSFINDIELSKDRKKWRVDKNTTILFDQAIECNHASTYKKGDVYIHLHDINEQINTHCDVGMATAAALFKIEENKERKINVSIPLNEKFITSTLKNKKLSSPVSWTESLQNKCHLQIPDKEIQNLYEIAIRTLVLCSPSEVYPGPYTYKRFWYRDAAFIVHGLLCAGLIDRAEKALIHFPKYQDRSGYFHSQQGEWDSNGEVLWVLQRFYQLTNRLPKDIDWWPIIRRGAKWIIKKRLPENILSVHAGLLPAGFSAEHLGPNDFYYWDDFWSISGLRAASMFAQLFNNEKDQIMFATEADSLSQSVDKSLSQVLDRIGRAAMPASPHRRLDAGAIGSLAAGYPLQIFTSNDARLLDTVEFLLEKCFVDDGFFQDMIHSGINPYLTLHVAQVLLRNSDSRYLKLMKKVVNLASPTGQWPEAIHPRTLGGCMGDGQHAWAATEWVTMIRNCFVREEGDDLILCAGIPAEWLKHSENINFGPALTSFGDIKIDIRQTNNKIAVKWESNFHKTPKNIEVCLLEHSPVITNSNSTYVEFTKVINEA